MGNSSSKSKKKITSQDKAILDLKVQRDKLTQYQKKIQVILNREQEIAKIHLKNGDKKKALLALRMKKYQEQLIEKTDTQLMNLEELTHSIEFAIVEKDVISGLKNGNEVLKELNKEMSIEKVEDLMNETAEAIEYQNEISEILNGKLTVDDEDEIEKELAQIEAEEISKKMLSVPSKTPEETVPDVEKIINKVANEIKDSVENEEQLKQDLLEQMPEVPTTELPDIKIKEKESEKKPQLVEA